MPMQYITCFTFSALMISTFMKRLAAAVVASHITITAGLHVYGKRKRLQEDDDFEESKVTGQGVCVCLYMYMSMDVSGITLTSTIAAYFHLYLEMKTAFYILALLTSGICGGAGSLRLSDLQLVWYLGTLDCKI